jgi:molybdopterin-synthase adenylyltransferase
MSETTSPDDRMLLRYSRQLLLPEVDIAGQAALAQARCLVVGLGGLGCPAALYLAAAGVGTLVLADPDRIELSNLQRQILYGEADVGFGKVARAGQRLAACNSDIHLELRPERLAGAALEAAVAAVDVVLDASDNFATRYALNQAAVATGVPLVSGAAIRLEGQLAVFDPRQPESPCYACLYPETPQTEDDAPAERCTEAGVLGPVVGVIGTLQALEAIKLLTGAGEASWGMLLLFDALRLEWQRIRLPRDPACPVCRDRAAGS